MKMWIILKHVDYFLCLEVIIPLSLSHYIKMTNTRSENGIRVDVFKDEVLLGSALIKVVCMYVQFRLVCVLGIAVSVALSFFLLLIFLLFFTFYFFLMLKWDIIEHPTL